MNKLFDEWLVCMQMVLTIITASALLGTCVGVCIRALGWVISF